MTDQELANLGPLAALAGVWEGEKGDDVAPDPGRGTENNKYRERLTLTPIGAVENHEQVLYGLRYATMAWELGEDVPFHEEVGYWLWEPATKTVLRCFIVPRGVTVIAGGTAEPDAKGFELSAAAGSETRGICSNRFLEEEFKTVRYDLQVTIHDDDTWSYHEDTQLRIKGQQELFHHRDRNTLKRIG